MSKPARGYEALAVKTIDKAMTILSFFSSNPPEQRLSDLARAAGIDKVTAMRILSSLVSCGFVEQHPQTRHYRLGSAVLRLALVREASVPIAAAVQPILDQLTEEVGETSHACLFSGKHMTSVAVSEPSRPTRVFVDLTQPLPVHATASGQAFLAYAGDDTVEGVFRDLPLPTSYTSSTISSEEELRLRLNAIRERGCAVSTRSFEEEVAGIAAPVFDSFGRVQATISAACISSRMTPAFEREVEAAVRRACIEATSALGGEPPEIFLSKTRETV